MTNIQCDTCDRMLKEGELPENRDKHRTPLPFMPEPREITSQDLYKRIRI